MEPVVTIGILMYNEEKYIAKAIESAISQSYKNLRIIISDNCSTDSSFSIAEQYAAKDPRIELFRHAENKGPLYNFEFILEKVNSKYYVTLGAHDLFLPDYISNAVAVLEKENTIALAYPGAVIIDEEGVEQEAIKDNYDTGKLKITERIIKIAKNFENGYVIHGVFRVEVLKKLPIERVLGPDFLIVLLVNLYGTIARLPAVGFKRRSIRKETTAKQFERHEKEGIYSKVSSNPFNLLVSYLFKHLMAAKEISFREKINLIMKLKKIFSSRFGVNWKEILLVKKTA